jgi:hypothetical protein
MPCGCTPGLPASGPQVRIGRQCLDLGLLDEVAVDLVLVVMGEGNRPYLRQTLG